MKDTISTKEYETDFSNTDTQVIQIAITITDFPTPLQLVVVFYC